MSFSPVFHSDCKKCNSIWWLLIASLYLCIYLFGSLRANSLGGGGREGERGSTPRELARRLSIWGNWRCWRLSLLKDCRLYAPPVSLLDHFTPCEKFQEHLGESAFRMSRIQIENKDAPRRAVSTYFTLKNLSSSSFDKLPSNEIVNLETHKKLTIFELSK